MLAVHTSLVEPLPRRITAVYEEMLPRQPLRYVLADNLGAGKTVMTGQLIKNCSCAAICMALLDDRPRVRYTAGTTEPRREDRPLHPRIRLASFDYRSRDHTFFVTLCTHERKPVFRNAEIAQMVVDALLWKRNQGQILLHAYCLMPDHLHALLQVNGERLSLGVVMGGIKSFTTRSAWNAGHSGTLWQARFYDHVVRDDEDAQRIADYILNNPVRTGLVEQPQEYSYSGMPDPL